MIGLERISSSFIYELILLASVLDTCTVSNALDVCIYWFLVFLVKKAGNVGYCWSEPPRAVLRPIMLTPRGEFIIY